MNVKLKKLYCWMQQARKEEICYVITIIAGCVLHIIIPIQGYSTK